jgi:hypothetical protein
MAALAEIAEFGLSKERTSTRNIIEKIATVVISIVITVSFTHIDDEVTRQRNIALALISLAATLVIFKSISVFSESSISEDIRVHSRDYWRLVQQSMQLLRYAPLFLLTHFVSATVIGWYRSSDLIWHETAVAMWCTFALIYFAIELAKKPPQIEE